jgi:hypothetical protein
MGGIVFAKHFLVPERETVFSQYGILNHKTRHFDSIIAHFRWLGCQDFCNTIVGIPTSDGRAEWVESDPGSRA